MLKIINCLEKIEAEALAKNKQKEGVEITIQEIIPRTTSNIKLNQNLSQSKLDNFLKKSDQEISKKEENSNKKDSKEELEWSKLKSSSSDLKKSALKRERAENAENYIKDDLKKKKNLK